MGISFEDFDIDPDDPSDPKRAIARKIMAHDLGKRNKGRKHPNRKRPEPALSKQERRAADKLRKSATKKDHRKNRKFLESLLGKEAPDSFRETLTAFGAPERRFSVEAHGRKRLKAVLPAYALWWELIHAVQPAHYAEFLKRAVRDRVPDDEGDFLPWLLQLTIDYMELDEATRKRVINRKALSRDAQALRLLALREIGPWAVLAIQKKYGGGLDRWSRLMAARNKKLKLEQSQAGDGEKPEEGTAVRESEAHVVGGNDDKDMDDGDAASADQGGTEENNDAGKLKDGAGPRTVASQPKPGQPELVRIDAGVEFGDHLLVLISRGRDQQLAVRESICLQQTGPRLRCRKKIRDLMKSIISEAKRTKIKVTKG